MARQELRIIESLPHERITLRFAGTYYFAYELDAFLSRDLILIRTLSDYFETAMLDYARSFQKWTALHMFSSYYINAIFEEDLNRATHIKYARRGACNKSWCRAQPAYLMATDLLEAHGVKSSPMHDVLGDWVQPDKGCCPEPPETDGPEIDDLWSEWTREKDYQRLLEQLSEELFYVLFSNRSFLEKFNKHMAEWLRIYLSDDYVSPEGKNLLRTDSSGQTCLRRIQPPEWAKRAVFFRDRGYCCHCGRNLNSVHSPINYRQYDHIVPLAGGGLNDVTNLQLLCRECNSKKGVTRKPVSPVYERWYPVDRSSRKQVPETLESIILSLDVSE